MIRIGIADSRRAGTRKYRLVLAAGTVLAAMACMVANAVAQPPPTENPQPRRQRILEQRRRFAPNPAAETPEQKRAWEIMGLFLREGMSQRYSGEQVTRLYMGRVAETRQIVKYDGPGRMRMEYLSPDKLKGETILITGGHIFHYKPPPENKILEGVALPEEFQARAVGFRQGVKNGTIHVQVVGQELIAGQQCSIVEIRSVGGGHFYLRFWIDEQTGVRLKIENRDPQGRSVSETAFTKVDYVTPIPLTEFRPSSLPNVPHEARLPDTPPMPNVATAQLQVGYAIREPAVPAGYHLNGVWVVTGRNGRKTTILRYTDGVNTFALFEVPVVEKQLVPGAVRPRAGLRAILHTDVAHWSSGGLNFALIGHMRRETMQSIVESLTSKAE